VLREQGSHELTSAVHNDRGRLRGLAEGEAEFDRSERRFAAGPVITVPTVTLESDASAALYPAPNAYETRFSGKYSHRTIEGGSGDNLSQEAPEAFAQAIVDVDGAT
jgi:pimeloyl-ACP methyl ester carboxylesterase